MPPAMRKVHYAEEGGNRSKKKKKTQHSEKKKAVIQSIPRRVHYHKIGVVKARPDFKVLVSTPGFISKQRKKK